MILPGYWFHGTNQAGTFCAVWLFKTEYTASNMPHCGIFAYMADQEGQCNEINLHIVAPKNG
jgi:hypothetical protein